MCIKSSDDFYRGFVVLLKITVEILFLFHNFLTNLFYGTVKITIITISDFKRISCENVDINHKSVISVGVLRILTSNGLDYSDTNIGL